MAKATVMVYTTLRARLGFSRIELEGGSVGELLRGLVAAGKNDIAGLLFASNGSVRGHFVLTLNSELLDNGKAAGVRVKPGDVLHIFPPVSGG